MSAQRRNILCGCKVVWFFCTDTTTKKVGIETLLRQLDGVCVCLQPLLAVDSTEQKESFIRANGIDEQCDSVSAVTAAS